MSGLFQNIYIKVLFSASNLNGVAAVFLSYALGSWVGSVIFAGAAIIGCMNKYRSLKGRNNFQNFWLKRFTDPSLTAQILMVAAGINAIMAGYNVFNDPVHMMHHIFLTLAWTFGVLGDDALRRNDKTNFSLDIIAVKRHIVLKTFIYVTRNPVFYYLFVNVFFACGVLTMSQQQEPYVVIFTSIAIVSGLIGIIYSSIQAYKVLSGGIKVEETNNGVTNILLSIANFSIGITAAIGMMIWLLMSQIIYCVVNILLLFETRNALEKENI